MDLKPCIHRISLVLTGTCSRYEYTAVEKLGVS